MRLQRGVDHPTYLAPKLKKETSYTSSPLQGRHGLMQGELYLYLYLYFTCSTTPQVFHTHLFIHHGNIILLTDSVVKQHNSSSRVLDK